MRTWATIAGVLLVATAARAQEAPAEAPPAAPEETPVAPSASEAADAAPQAAAEPTEAAQAETTTTATAAPAPKVAVVITGDPDPLLVAAALEIEGRLTLSSEVRQPSDPALRAALRGEAGSDGDGLDEVRRERRRLGLGESSDAPILQRLGRRAGAVVVVVVREAAAGPEAIALDVRTGQFFEGALGMAEPDPAAITAFVSRRARVAVRGATAPDAAATATVAADEGPPTARAAEGATETPEDDGQDAGEWLEQNWPYFAAGALLAAAIAFVAVTATDDGDPQPMLRFTPGTP